MGRVPPYSQDAERKVLGAILVRREALSVCHGLALDAASFHVPMHGAIYAAMLDLEAAGQPPDATLVEARLGAAGTINRVPDCALYLADLMLAVPTAENVEHWARVVADDAAKRQVIVECAEIAAKAYQPGDVAEVLDYAQARMFALGQRANRDTGRPFSEIIPAVLTAMEQRHDRGEAVTGVPTGFLDLDAKTAGLQPSDLVILAGRPAMGKSALAMNIVRHAAGLGIPCLVFSLEMDRDSIGERAICSEARVDSQSARTARLTGDEWARIGTAAAPLCDLPIVVDDAGALTVTEIRARARRWRARYGEGLALVVVDYLQLVRGPKADTHERSVAEVSQGLKALAKELRCPVLALSQLNRKLEGRDDKRPQMADLRESGALEADADLIALLYRDEYYHPDSADRGIAEVIIGKQRKGPTGTVKLAFRAAYVRFGSLAQREFGG